MLALSLGGLSVVMFLACCVLTLLVLVERGESLGGMRELGLFVPFLAFPVVGTLIAARVPRNAIGWVCLCAGLCWMALGTAEQLGLYLVERDEWTAFSAKLAAVIQGWWVPPVALLGVYMILLFPDGRLPSRRWRPLAWLAGILMVVLTIGFAFFPGPLLSRPGIENPFGIEALGRNLDLVAFVILLLPMCILASATSLVLRYRRAQREVREQIKWLALAASFLGVTYLGGLSAQFVFLDPESSIEPAWVEFTNVLTFIGYAGIPIAVGFAVLRYRLYDIEVIINRALVYGSLTLFLIFTYLASVVSLQYVFRTISGRDSELAVVASTLAIAALFVPLRRRLQRFVDRRFYRSKYDARRTLEAFSKRLRDETDLETLSGDLVGVVRETVQPVHASLWLREPGRGEKAG